MLAQLEIQKNLPLGRLPLGARSLRRAPLGSAGPGGELLDKENEMMTYTEARRAYRKLANQWSELMNSPVAAQARLGKLQGDLQVYLDLKFFPSSPFVVGLNQGEREIALRAAQPAFLASCQFAKRRYELRKALAQALAAALHALGERTGLEYLAMPGAFDKRVQTVLSRADMTRKYQLDGLGYANVIDEDDPFAKGFFAKSKLQRDQMYADLKLCTGYRYRALMLSDEELYRLGLAEEVCDESR